MQVRPLPSTQQLAVAQWDRAPPSEGGGHRFESCRRDAAITEVIRPDEGPVPKTGRGASPCGCESHRFLHTAVVQRTRRRALTPETRVQLSVAVLDARSSNGRTPDCYSGYGGSSPSLAAAAPGGRGSRHAAATRVTQVRVLFGRPSQIMWSSFNGEDLRTPL